MRRYREFQFDVNFDPADFKAFIEYLHSNNQRYIPIIDAAVGMVYNETDSYDFYQKGHELDVWMHNPDGSEFVGQVWPGLTVFPGTSAQVPPCSTLMSRVTIKCC